MRAVPLGPGDAEFLLGLRSDESVAATLGGARDREAVDRAIAESTEHWEAHGFGRWILRVEGHRVGTAKLAYCHWTGTPEVELGYAIAPAMWNQGYATEAAQGDLSYAREQTSVVTVVAVVVRGNPRTVSVLKHLQFDYEGELELPEGPHALYRGCVR